MRNRNVLIIAAIDWSENHQIAQRLAIDFAASGNRVLFVENTGSRAVNFADLARLRARFGNWRRSSHGFRQVRPNITLLSPILLPFPYSRLAGIFNRWQLCRAVRRWTRVSHFGDPVVVTFLPTPLSQALARDVNPALLVYYCANDMAGISPSRSPARRWENILFRDADLVFVTAESLRERALAHNRHVYSFPAGVEFTKFSAARLEADVPTELRALPRPILGYVGTLGRVLDQDLLVKLAQSMPEASVVLVGPEYSSTRQLQACSNIQLTGEVPHDDVPRFIKGFDVALIPYIKTPYTDAVYSCKLTEYLAMGVPVVTTDLREMHGVVDRHGPVIEVGKDSDDFIAKVRLALQQTTDGETQRRIAVAEENSAERRFAEMMEAMEQRLRERAMAAERWQESFIRVYRQHRGRLLSRLAILAALYLLVFYTPLAWLAGHQLVVRQQPRAAGAIVVFSGNGEAAYTNPSYQRRALDAAEYYKAGYAQELIISSGKRQTFDEEEIIRALLVAQGVPEQAIHVLEKYPTSTFENVQFVHEVLKQRGIKSILFITAPYHSRRAMMIWKRNASDLDVVTVPVVDTPAASPQWTTSLAQIRAIAYEYLAILYNWRRGWL